MSLDRYVDARSPRALLGARLEILGAALLVIALALGVRVAVVLSMLAGQLLMVIGGHCRGASRAGLIAEIATPFLLMLLAAGSVGAGKRGSGTTLFEFTDFGFLLLLLAVTPVSVIVSLWLTRNPDRRRSRR